MRGILAVLHSDTEVTSALNDSTKIIAPASSYPFLISLIAENKPLLVVTSSSRGAEDLSEYLTSLHPRVYEFPAWETLPHERLSPRSDTVARRLSTLYSLTENQRNPIVVAPVRAVIHRFIESLAKSPLWTLEIGQEIGLTALINHLTELSFTRTDLVEKRGEFAVRGGIVDVFLPLAVHPVRIDFFGDEIEELSYFEVADQRTSDPVIGKLAILPCRELLLTDAIRARAESMKDRYPSAIEILDKISQGMIVEGMESLIPLLTDDFDTILDRMPKGTEVIFIDDERIRSRTADLIETNREFLEASWSNAAIGGAAPLPVENVTYLDWKQLQEEITKLSLKVQALNTFGSDLDTDAHFLDISAIDPMRGNVEALCELLRTGLEAHHAVIFSTTGHGMAERYAGIFRDADLPVQMVETLSAHPTKGSIHVTQSSLGYGFKSDHAQILFVTERDLSGSKTSTKDGARMPTKRKQAIDPLELRTGDFVVHEQH